FTNAIDEIRVLSQSQQTAQCFASQALAFATGYDPVSFTPGVKTAIGTTGVGSTAKFSDFIYSVISSDGFQKILGGDSYEKIGDATADLFARTWRIDSASDVRKSGAPRGLGSNRGRSNSLRFTLYSKRNHSKRVAAIWNRHRLCDALARSVHINTH